MLIDTHIHVGQFHNLYFSPNYIHELMNKLGISFYAVSSTTQCEENYPKVLTELAELKKVDGNKVLPIMWITPESLQGNIAWYLESQINWKMLKIHPSLHPSAWCPNGDLINEVLDISKEMKLPLLIHTGNEEFCSAALYEQTIRANPDVTFILAHGRSIDASLRIAQTYQNAFVDSAFMPIEHMQLFITKGLSEKLLWGTDMCIPKYFYPHANLYRYYTNKLNTFRDVCTQKQYELVTYRNAMLLFNIS